MNPIRSMQELLEIFPDEKYCIEHVENLRWGSKPISPFDMTSEVYKCSNGKYKCKNTDRYFNVRTGTIFEDSRISLQKWIQAFYIISNETLEVSSYKLAKDIGITQKSAWHLLQKLKYTLNHPKFNS